MREVEARQRRPPWTSLREESGTRMIPSRCCPSTSPTPSSQVCLPLADSLFFFCLESGACFGATGAELVGDVPHACHCGCVADWLVDRKKIPADWRKKVASLRARIAAALASLPLSQDPWLQTCTAESECDRVVFLLGFTCCLFLCPALSLISRDCIAVAMKLMYSAFN